MDSFWSLGRHSWLNRDGHYIRFAAAHCEPSAIGHVKTNNCFFSTCHREDVDYRDKSRISAAERIRNARFGFSALEEEAIRTRLYEICLANRFSHSRQLNPGPDLNNERSRQKPLCPTFDEKGTYKRFRFTRNGLYVTEFAERIRD